jgi:hypothetical protein
MQTDALDRAATGIGQKKHKHKHKQMQGNYECLILRCHQYGDIISSFELGKFQALGFVEQVSKLASHSETRQVRLLGTALNCSRAEIRK